MASKKKGKDEISLADAYALSTPEQNKTLYDKWAPNYDAEFVADDYIYPRIIAEYLATLIDEDEQLSVVDIGCGTGAVGEHFARLRPLCDIEGVDISPQMIAQAETKIRPDGKPVYQEFHEVNLTKPIYFAQSVYDFMVSAGTFTLGHLGVSDMLAISRVLKPMGIACVGINKQHFEQHGFRPIIAEAVEERTITQPEYVEVDIYGPSSEHHGDKAIIAVFGRPSLQND
jgi:predicted TPR repeat methyltransferase